MKVKFSYPKIMESDQLDLLNKFVIEQLGTPIFFLSPKPTRPKADSPYGVLYEVITGLYVIYKDYGMKIFHTYLEFCVKNFPEDSNFVFSHYTSVDKLRGGMCHGSMPRGKHAKGLLNTLNYYIGTPKDGEWPETFSLMTQEQCKQIVKKLSISSNRLLDYVKKCAILIGGDKELLQRWRDTLWHNALNGESEQYGKNTTYFDERIVLDIEGGILNGYRCKPHKDVVKQWLIDLKPLIKEGNIKQTTDMYQMLHNALYKLYNPTSLSTSRSSADIGFEGFEL